MIRILAVIAFSLIALTALAQSQRQRTPSKQQTQPSIQDQRGTQSSPLMVKILSAEDANERKEKAELDRKLVDFNGDLAFYTQILAWVAGFQFLALGGADLFFERRP